MFGFGPGKWAFKRNFLAGLYPKLDLSCSLLRSTWSRLILMSEVRILPLLFHFPCFVFLFFYICSVITSVNWIQPVSYVSQMFLFLCLCLLLYYYQYCYNVQVVWFSIIIFLNFLGPGMFCCVLWCHECFKIFMHKCIVSTAAHLT